MHTTTPLHAPFIESKLPDESAQMQGLRRGSQEFAITGREVASHAVCNRCSNVWADRERARTSAPGDAITCRNKDEHKIAQHKCKRST